MGNLKSANLTEVVPPSIRIAITWGEGMGRPAGAILKQGHEVPHGAFHFFAHSLLFPSLSLPLPLIATHSLQMCVGSFGPFMVMSTNCHFHGDPFKDFLVSVAWTVSAGSPPTPKWQWDPLPPKFAYDIGWWQRSHSWKRKDEGGQMSGWIETDLGLIVVDRSKDAPDGWALSCLGGCCWEGLEPEIRTRPPPFCSRTGFWNKVHPLFHLSFWPT